MDCNLPEVRIINKLSKYSVLHCKASSVSLHLKLIVCFKVNQINTKLASMLQGAII